jgi:hypothetical protein
MGSPPDIAPENRFQSIGFTLAARTAIRIWPGPACGGLVVAAVGVDRAEDQLTDAGALHHDVGVAHGVG